MSLVARPNCILARHLRLTVSQQQLRRERMLLDAERTQGVAWGQKPPAELAKGRRQALEGAKAQAAQEAQLVLALALALAMAAPPS